MPLDEYWRKRDFARTLEPRGAGSGPELPSLRRFVVQRHRATRLHYDFRLEIDGVLVSWAVPRGPSMQPLAKRRAARTEDHPVEYLDFEGTIAAGQYGGGDVIVWDHGIWEPEADDAPSASVAAGELKFVLHGERLKGRFAIVRTSEAGAREQWLLIRKRDEYSDDGWQVDDHPTSVLTGRINEEVAAGLIREVKPGRRLTGFDLAAARPEPSAVFVTPMLATAVDVPFSDAEWLYELKLDGYRVQAVVRAGALRLWTRNHQDAAVYFPDFAGGSPDWLAVHEAVVDGEMVALDAAGRPDFSLLGELAGLRGLGVKRGELKPDDGSPEPRGGRLVYHVFDLLHLDGLSLLDVPLDERKRLLRLVLLERPSVRYVSHVLEHGRDFHAAVVAQGLEGSIAKRRDGRYEPGVRSRSWLKVKARREQELVVIGYEPGQGSRRDLGSLLVATHEAEGWRFAGHVGSGLDAATRKLFRRLIDDTSLAEPAVPRVPASSSARYCEPRHVIRAAFAEWTPDGLLRQAAYKGHELGRDPLSVSREVTEAGPVAAAAASRPARSQERGTTLDAADAPSASELEALEALGTGGSWEVRGHLVELSNLDKVLFPEAGFTKRDLVRYYASIAPAILPYLRERPLNVHRWPDGVTGKTRFWQKQIPAHAPEWVGRWEYPDAGRSQSHTYVVADRVATMAWLANQAVIDLHPWTSRLPEYRRPTYAYIDIDPGTETTWLELVTLARLYRTALEHLGVRGYPKVTGQRGIQIWIRRRPALHLRRHA